MYWNSALFVVCSCDICCDSHNWWYYNDCISNHLDGGKEHSSIAIVSQRERVGMGNERTMSSREGLVE